MIDGCLWICGRNTLWLICSDTFIALQEVLMLSSDSEDEEDVDWLDVKKDE